MSSAQFDDEDQALFVESEQGFLFSEIGKSRVYERETIKAKMRF